VLAVWLSVAAVASAAMADENADITVAQAAGEEKPAESTPTEKAPGEAAEPRSAGVPAGVEVLQVKGRGAAAIEADVPSSLTLFDAKTIEALGAQDISDLSRVTPNVNIVQPGSTQAVFFVRGVGLSDFSSNAAGAVTIFQDDVSLNAPAIQTGQLYDVEGIEVMRGPQGTGPYRNASAGAIRVRSRRPTGNYTSSLRSSLGYYDTKGNKGAHKALIQDYEGAVEMPIVSALSTRFAFRLRDADPYKTNGCGALPPLLDRPPNAGTDASLCGEGPGSLHGPGNRSFVPAGLPTRVQDEHNWAARGTLRFHPEDSDIDLFLNGHGSRLDQDSTLGQAIGTNIAFPISGAPNPGPSGGELIRFGGITRGGYVDPDVRTEFERLCARPAPNSNCSNPFTLKMLSEKLAEGRPLDEKPYRGDYDRVGRTTRDAYGTFVSGEGNVFEDVKLSAIASYDTYERSQDADTDFTPDVLFEQLQNDRAWQIYDQLQLEGELSAEPIQWNLGAYFLEEELNNDGTFFLAGRIDPNTGTPQAYTRNKYKQFLDSAAVWGGFSWDFADDFTLEGGVRYNWEQKKFRIFVDQNVIGPRHARDTQEDSWSTPTGQLILTYHIDPEKSAYAKYARGFKAGHFNALATVTKFDPLTQIATDPPAKEEYNDSWEAGLKGGWLDRRVSLSSSFFYYRYTNYQVFLFTDAADPSEPPRLAILNADQAENFGAEVEGTFLPLQGWTPPILSGLRLSANFSWLHGEYIDFGIIRQFVTTSGTGISRIPVDYSGKQLQNAPEYKVSATAEWTFDLGRFGFVIPRYDVNWSDDVFFDPNEGHGSVDPTGGPALIDYGVGQKAYFLHNVRLAYRTPSGNVELAGWIRNVEDRVYKNFAFDASGFSDVVINFVGEPRTYGMDLTITF
jgi:outer membrane receptor protein involved in Fe transport